MTEPFACFLEPATPFSRIAAELRGLHARVQLPEGARLAQKRERAVPFSRHTRSRHTPRTNLHRANALEKVGRPQRRLFDTVPREKRLSQRHAPLPARVGLRTRRRQQRHDLRRPSFLLRKGRRLVTALPAPTLAPPNPSPVGTQLLIRRPSPRCRHPPRPATVRQTALARPTPRLIAVSGRRLPKQGKLRVRRAGSRVAEPAGALQPRAATVPSPEPCARRSLPRFARTFEQGHVVRLVHPATIRGIPWLPRRLALALRTHQSRPRCAVRTRGNGRGLHRRPVCRCAMGRNRLQVQLRWRTPSVRPIVASLRNRRAEDILRRNGRTHGPAPCGRNPERHGAHEVRRRCTVTAQLVPMHRVRRSGKKPQASCGHIQDLSAGQRLGFPREGQVPGFVLGHARRVVGAGRGCERVGTGSPAALEHPEAIAAVRDHQHTLRGGALQGGVKGLLRTDQQRGKHPFAGTATGGIDGGWWRVSVGRGARWLGRGGAAQKEQGGNHRERGAGSHAQEGSTRSDEGRGAPVHRQGDENPFA